MEERERDTHHIALLNAKHTTTTIINTTTNNNI